MVRARWTIVEDVPGAIVAYVTSGGHSATVRIEYGPQGWVILHVQSSPELKFDPDYRGRAVIHRRYNHWVDRLNRHIDRALREQQATMAPAPAPTPTY